jgi:hypothetical protein
MRPRAIAVLQDPIVPGQGQIDCLEEPGKMWCAGGDVFPLTNEDLFINLSHANGIIIY